MKELIFRKVAEDVEFRVALTDDDWFTYFRTHPAQTEMNFWRPGGTHTDVCAGSLWLFLLRNNKIAGCAQVEVSTTLPLWLAWETFAAANGFESREEFYARIALRRHEKQTALDTVIGCVGLTSPVFFDTPFDFAPFQDTWTNKSQPTKRYSLRSDMGQALWAAVQARLYKSSDSISAGPTMAPRQLVKVRLGQGGFRTRVTQAYEKRCAVTGERSLPALDAAHIKPYSLVNEHSVNNGLLLRADLHKLFDAGFVCVTPDLQFRVSSRLREVYSNGRVYYEMDGRNVRLPASLADAPGREYLEWHAAEVFRA